MKKTGVTLFLVSLCFLAFGQQDMPGMKMPAKKERVKQPKEKIIYTCPMHPQIQQDKPGNCPICKMKLVKKKIKIPASKQEQQHHNQEPVKKDTTQMMQDHKQINMAPDHHIEMNEGHPKEKIPEIEQQQVFFGKGKTVRYDLFVSDTIVNFTGMPKHAYAIIAPSLLLL